VGERQPASSRRNSVDPEVRWNPEVPVESEDSSGPSEEARGGRPKMPGGHPKMPGGCVTRGVGEPKFSLHAGC
jgi:hypothetical protein